MGRITVFTRWDDLNSKQMVKELEQRGLPYQEVDLSKFPNSAKSVAKAVDAKVNAPSVPHVYFNTRYVGGVEACIEELKKWDNNKRYKSAVERYQAEIGKGFDPTAEHLSLPDPETALSVEPAKSRHANYLVEFPEDRPAMTLREAMEHLKKWMPLTKCEYNQRTYKRSFTGRTFVSSLQHALDISFEDSWLFAQDLCDQGIIRHVDTKMYPLPQKNCVFTSSHDVYQLQCHAEPNVLNSYIKWPKTERIPTDCLGVVDNLGRLLSVMELSSIDPDDGLLNSQHCVKLQKFSLFEEAICELQHLSKTSLLLLNDNEMTAFALNLYSVLVRYANLKVGMPRTEDDRIYWMEKTKFYLAGELYSLQGWVDMLLGKTGLVGVASASNLSYSQRDDLHSDSTDLLSLKQDNRLHFALFLGPHCGSRWSTTFSSFNPDNLEKELEIAAKVFCLEDNHVKVDRSEGTLYLFSPVFKTNLTDFCASESDLPKFVLPLLSGQKRLDLQYLINSSSKGGSKPVKISFLGPNLGLHTISGPWFDAPKLADNSYSFVITKSSRGNGSRASSLTEGITLLKGKKKERRISVASTVTCSEQRSDPGQDLTC